MLALQHARLKVYVFHALHLHRARHAIHPSSSVHILSSRPRPPSITTITTTHHVHSPPKVNQPLRLRRRNPPLFGVYRVSLKYKLTTIKKTPSIHPSLFIPPPPPSSNSPSPCFSPTPFHKIVSHPATPVHPSSSKSQPASPTPTYAS